MLGTEADASGWGRVQVLQSFKHQVHRSKKIDFIEQFNEKLLVKQEYENLQIIDVHHPPSSRNAAARCGGH